LGIPFDRNSNHPLRGVSRMESLEIILEKSTRRYSSEEKRKLAERKNTHFRELLKGLSPADILPGVLDLIKALKQRQVKVAIGSSSRNARPILSAVGLENEFDAVVDGNLITRSKPDPEVFRIAAEQLGVSPEECLVVEDADAGIEAGLAAGMKVLAVGSAAGHAGATRSAENLSCISVDELLLAEKVCAR